MLSENKPCVHVKSNRKIIIRVAHGQVYTCSRTHKRHAMSMCAGRLCEHLLLRSYR
jgi:hypothetical protein